MTQAAEHEEIYCEHQYDWSWNEYHPVFTGYQQCKPNHKVGPTAINISSIHYVLSGTGVFVSNGNEYHITKNQMFCINPMEPICYKADEQDPWTYVWIGYIASDYVPFHFNTPVIDAPYLRPIFESIRDYPDHDNTGRDFTTHCLNEIVKQICNHRGDTSYLVNRAVQYIRCNFNDASLSVATLAAHLQVSRYKLLDTFMCEKNISPVEFIVRFRLEKACEYMTHQRMSPTIAANAVGYHNYRHFSKMFKKYYNSSPSAFRRNALRAQEEASSLG